MKSDIHPTVHKDAKVTCTGCSAVFQIPGTVEEQQIEVCSQCHPVYTGKFRGLMSSGRVDRFRKKLELAEQTKATAKPKKRRLTAEEKLEKKLEEKRAEKIEKEKKEKTKKVKQAEKTVKKTKKK